MLREISKWIDVLIFQMITYKARPVFYSKMAAWISTSDDVICIHSSSPKKKHLKPPSGRPSMKQAIEV